MQDDHGSVGISPSEKPSPSASGLIAQPSGAVITDPERPSRHGAILGAGLAQLADAGRRAMGVDADAMCATCAFRAGSMPNQMAATGLTAFNCAIGIDRDPFGCHHGLALDGQPTKLCAGWLAAQKAPFAVLKEVTARVSAALAQVDGDDPIRAEFDAWIAPLDPDNQLDNYQRARLWLRRQSFPEGVATTPTADGEVRDAHSAPNDRTQKETPSNHTEESKP